MVMGIDDRQVRIDDRFGALVWVCHRNVSQKRGGLLGNYGAVSAVARAASLMRPTMATKPLRRLGLKCCSRPRPLNASSASVAATAAAGWPINSVASTAMSPLTMLE